VHPHDSRDLGGDHPPFGGEPHDQRADPEAAVLGRAVRAVQLGVLLGAEPVDANGVHGPLLLGPLHLAFPLPLYLALLCHVTHAAAAGAGSGSAGTGG
jgi:hypothetical protein